MSAQDMTPSEVALAKVLAAWDAWTPTADDNAQRWVVSALGDIEGALSDAGMVFNSRVTQDGTNLLDRARKAGVL